MRSYVIAALQYIIAFVSAQRGGDGAAYIIARVRTSNLVVVLVYDLSSNDNKQRVTPPSWFISAFLLALRAAWRRPIQEIDDAFLR